MIDDNWGTLNMNGRCFVRRHYRLLRRLGVDRRHAHLISNAVVYGIAMSHSFGPYVG